MSLFGTFGQQQQPQQPQQQQSLFGQSTTQQPQQSSSLFGNAQQGTGTGLLGGQQQQGGVFGKPAGGLFGQPSTASQQGGGLFGGSLFGGQQNTNGAGLLTSQQQPQQQQGSGAFGQSNQSTGLLGGQQQQGGTGWPGSTQPAAGGLFGGAQSQQGGGILGGQLQNQLQQQGWQFGQPMQSQMSGTGAFGQQPQNSMTLQSTQMQQQQQSSNVIVDKLGRIKIAWDPGHPDYAFKYYLYNYIGEDRANLYQKPPADDLAEWEKAWAERPNKGSVPVLAKGFKDLETRVKSQEEQVNVFRHRLHEIQDKLDTLQNRHDLVTSIKLEDCRRRHNALSRRALSLAAKVQVMKNRGYALQPEEELMKKRLEGLARAVWDPAVRGRVNEIWARMMVVGEQARMMEESVGKVEIVWDEKQLQISGKLLQSNAAGLEYLTKELKEIEKTFAQWEEEQKSRPRGF